MSKKLITIFAFLFSSFFVFSFLNPALAAEQFQPGDIVTYTIDYQNEGNDQAQDVEITQPIPTGTTYVSGSLIVDGVSRTDAKDGDNADYNETVVGSVYFLIPNVAPGNSGYVSFQVQVNEGTSEQIEGQASSGYQPPESETSSGTVVLSPKSEEVPPTCTPDWQCTEWSECVDSLQTRTCQDLNTCGTIEGKPAESQTCEIVSPPPEEQPPEEQPPEEQPPEEQPPSEEEVLVPSEGEGVEEGLPSGGEVSPKEEGTLPGEKEIIPKEKEEKKTNVAALLDNITKQFKNLAKIYQKQIRENEPLQKINKRAVLPAVSVAVIANTFASIPLAAAGWPVFQYLFQLIRFLFTQPAYLLAKRRRYWGTVYNSLSKQPIGLAVIRLYDAASKKLVTTRVTGPDGRYFFLVEPEKDYYIEVKAPGFVFPSKYLADKSEDGTYEDLYYGKTIRFNRGERPFISSNIPLDAKKGEVYISPFMKPVKTKVVDLTSFVGLSSEERKKEDKKILTAFSKKRASALFAHLGPVLAFICLVLSPTLYTYILFLVHISFLLLFRHLAQGKGAKPWGEVFDKKSNERLARAIIRLFDTQYGKLLLSNVTGKRGRYGFLIGNDKYVLTCEKEKYRLPEEKVEIQGQKEGIVHKDLGMEKK